MCKTVMLWLVVLVQILALTLGKNLPSFVHVCKRNDPELKQCFIKTFEELRPHLRKGIPDLELPPGEPLHYFNASGSTGADSAVKLQGKTWNQVATGVMDVTIEDVNIDFDNARCVIDLHFPWLGLEGDYKLLGKVLLFEIDSQGHFEINMTDLKCTAELHGKYVTIKGENHIQFEKVELKLQMKNTKVYFSNIFEGNEALTETVNQAVNENIESIVQELHPILSDTFGGIARLYFNKFFKLFSVDELFPNE